MVDSVKYNEWLAMAQKDFKSAKILFEHDADNGIVCFHCQQAIEKYIKGYLIYAAGELHEGHSLLKLCKKAMLLENTFGELIKDLAFVNAFYVETRYPAEDPLIVTKEDVNECFKIVQKVFDKIDKYIDR